MRGLVVVLGAVLAMPVSAETVYITDILRLGQHQAQDTSDRAFRMLVSGTELEVLERVSNFARVRAPDGREGWVKSNYLVDEKPARLRASELEAQVAEHDDKLAAADEARQKAEQAYEKLTSDIAASENSSEAVQAKLQQLADDNERYQSRLESFRGSVPLSWVAVALLVVLGAGFLAGLWWIDFQSRRRHGGFRVY
ncbi:MAG: TIGR04211 family SH3 domain-containing protein [Gammaproteobacteria bacterium]